MLAFLIIFLALFIFWTLYGRGAYIVYKYEKDDGVALPENIGKTQIMEKLKNDLGYKDTKEIFFDENGEICIAGKYDTYSVTVCEDRIYLDDPLYSDIKDGTKAFTFLQKLGRFRIMSYRKKDRNRVEELLCLRAYVAKVFDPNAPVNAYKKYTSMTRARKYSAIVSIVCIALIVILFIVAINDGTKEQEIDSVKFAYLESYSEDVRIGDALEDYFASPVWETYSENSKDYVKFSGEFLYYEKDAIAVIKFEFMEQDWFRVSDITINGESLNDYEEDVFLTVIFENYDK